LDTYVTSEVKTSGTSVSGKNTIEKNSEGTGKDEISPIKPPQENNMYE
jgi:hypothetical protein